jgi:hypothetical protein
LHERAGDFRRNAVFREIFTRATWVGREGRVI